MTPKKLRKQHLASASRMKKARERDAKTSLLRLQSIVKPLLKRYGKDAFMTLGGMKTINVEAIPTKWQELDDILTGQTDKKGRTIAGTGIGVPKGRLIEISGPEASGKTTLALHLVAAAQKQGVTCAYVDVEHALDVPYAAKLGVRVDSMLFSQPDNGEQAMDIVRDLARTNKVGMIVVDSVAALEPQIEQKKKHGDATMGTQARLMSRALRGLSAVCNKSGCILIFINQIRMKIGVFWGNPETTPGGQALRFYASMRLDIRRTKTLKEKGRVVGHRARIRVNKNKVAVPFRELHVDILFPRGIRRVYANPELGSDDDDSTDDST